MLSPTYPITVVYDSPPLLRPKPIRPYLLDRSKSSKSNYAPHQEHADQPQRPAMIRASTMDGRSLSEVIDAAHQASLEEQKARRSTSRSLSGSNRTFGSSSSPYEDYGSNLNEPNLKSYSSSSSTSRASSLDNQLKIRDGRFGLESGLDPRRSPYTNRANSVDDAAFRRYPPL